MPGAKSGSRTSIYLVVIVLVVAGLVGWGIAMTRDGSGESVAGTYQTSVQGAVVIAGAPAATTVDVYEDLLCPVCGRFEARFGADLTKAINEGKIQVRYHPVAILNRATKPTGYSTRAANAVLCSAEAGVFQPYHDKLFAEQPREGSAGLSDQELIAKGKEVGAPDSFAQCVTSGKYNQAVTNETRRAVQDPSLRSDPSDDRFGTPTVTVNGKRVEVTDGWLDDILG